MKKFNVSVALCALCIYFSAWYSGIRYEANINDMSGMQRVTAEIVYFFNDTVWSHCNWCTIPDEPVVETEVINGEFRHFTRERFVSVADSRVTMTILYNTFPLVLFMMAAFNFFHYAGRAGTNGTWNGQKERFRKRGSDVGDYVWKCTFGRREKTVDNPVDSVETCVAAS